MKDKIKHFLAGSLVAVCIVCIGTFAVLAVYLNRQNSDVISDLGNIYMSSMNDRISRHFKTMTDHRLVQMETLAETIPPSYRDGKAELSEWLEMNGEARNFDSLAYFYSDGSLEMV